MKKLLIGVCLVLFVGCGADTSAEFDFYEEYYSECVSMCEECEIISNDCLIFSSYVVETCAKLHWDRGTASNSCLSYEKGMKLITDCTERLDEYSGLCWLE